ncbi:MAG TPA: toll/interleukin-1 receptor domain-containing protein [Thermoanaerobaculia bacterium]|nr:toll/interleukin-1 receptor domain-containing protein [Thermoanaerobaculia bacterium]
MTATATEFSHDVFVSYSHKDQPWVASVLVKALRDNGLKVLVDETEFEPGKSSIENMSDAILQSRRTVAVLTPNWVGSEWTRFEGLVTAQEDPTGARGRLLPILRQKCDPPKWLAIRSWIDFADDSAVSRQLTRLIRALGRPLADEPVVKAAPAEKALRTLPDLMREDRAVREALLEYRVRIENIIDRTERVIAFKAVHDHLHNIQLRCYDRIVSDAPRLATDDTVADSLDAYAYDLLTTVEELRKLDEDPIFTSSRLTWINTLQRAYETLAGAVQARDTTKIKQAASLIDRVLAAEPARIDARLFESAEALGLDAVSEAVSFVSERAKDGGMSAEKLAPLCEARDVLEQLDENLAMLVRSHNLWQEVDVVIRRVDSNLATDTFELTDSWPELRGNVEALSASTAEWAKRLRDDERAVDAAIAANDATAMVRAFRRFRQKAAMRFFQLDRDLKTQCGELGEVSKPLAHLVEALA